MKIIHLDDIWITANFKETQLRDMKLGQRVDIEVDANGKTTRAKSIASPGPAAPASACCRRRTRRAIT